MSKFIKCFSVSVECSCNLFLLLSQCCGVPHWLRNLFILFISLFLQKTCSMWDLGSLRQWSKACPCTGSVGVTNGVMGIGFWEILLLILFLQYKLQLASDRCYVVKSHIPFLSTVWVYIFLITSNLFGDTMHRSEVMTCLSYAVR